MEGILEIEVLERDIDKIIPYERNPRKNDEAVDKVVLSLKEFGWQQPIVVDAEGVIVVGHTRWKAAKKLNYKTCPVIVASTLSPEQIKAYRIADNKSGEIATWDMDLLKMEVQDLIKADFDVELTGFDLEELELNDDVNYSDKNKEIDVDSYDDTMTMKFKFTEEQYLKVKEKLSEYSENLEQALLKVLQIA